MGLSCGAACAKYLLLIYNIIFWLSGGALIGLGVWFLVDPAMLSYLGLLQVNPNDPYLKIASWVFIGIGCFIFLVGFVGCCGALRESRCLLGFYIFLLLLIMGAELAIGILTAIYKNDLNAKLQDQLAKSIRTDYGLSATEAWNLAQFTLQCCGSQGVNDYKGSYWSQNSTRTGQAVPWSCCRLKNQSVGKSMASVGDSDYVDRSQCQSDARSAMEDPKVTSTAVYLEGCSRKLEEWFRSHVLIFIIFGCAIAGLELLGFVFAICLCRSIDEYDPNYE